MVLATCFQFPTSSRHMVELHLWYGETLGLVMAMNVTMGLSLYLLVQDPTELAFPCHDY